MASRFGTLGSARVEVEVALDKFNRDLVKTRRATETATQRMGRSFGTVGTRLQGLEAQFTRVGRAVGLFAGAIGLAAGGGLVALATQAVRTGDELAKTADKIGVTTDELQELQFAIGQTTTLTDKAIGVALQRFSRRVGEAANGTGELKDTLAEYGIEVRDAAGNQRRLSDIFGDLAEAVKGAKSEQEALRIAFKAFDSEGASIVNTLRQGEDGFKGLRDRARELGLVIEERLLRNAEALKSDMDALATVIRANLTRAILQLTPALLDLTEFLLSPEVTGAFRALGDVGVAALERIREEVQKVRNDLQALGRAFDDLKAFATSGRSIAESLPFTEDQLRTMRRSGVTILQLRDAARDVEAQLDEIAAIGNEAAGGVDQVGDAADKTTPKIEAARDALARFREQLDDTAAAGERVQPFGGEPPIPALRPGLGPDPALGQSASARHRENARAVQQEIDGLATGYDEARISAETFAAVAAGGLLDAARGADSFGDSIQNLIIRIAEMVAQMALFATIAQGFGAFGFGGIGFGAIPGRAGGGAVSKNRLYRVNEVEQEFFIPPSAGKVVGATSLASSMGSATASAEEGARGGDMVFQIDARGAQAGTQTAILQTLMSNSELIAQAVGFELRHNKGLRDYAAGSL